MKKDRKYILKLTDTNDVTAYECSFLGKILNKKGKAYYYLSISPPLNLRLPGRKNITLESILVIPRLLGDDLEDDASWPKHIHVASVPGASHDLDIYENKELQSLVWAELCPS